MRLDKFLADMGIVTRRQCKKFMKQHSVTVNDQRILDTKFKVDVDKDSVKVNDEVIIYQQYYYIMLNKPAGVISATEDNFHETVIDLVAEHYHHVDLFPVGRLDIDTVGLLLLTNDGQLAHRLLSPKHHVAKCYYAHIDKALPSDAVLQLQSGIVLEDGTQCLPASLEIISEQAIKLTIYEGKFHQVKRMIQALGSEVTYLQRLTMGTLKLDEQLTEGEYRALTADELSELLG